MNTPGINLFIVDDNKLSVMGLKHSLYKKFGTGLNISTFTTGVSCLEKVDKNTNFVILDYFLDGENGNEILKSIKLINPKIEVIMLSSNDDVGTIIESFREGATDYLIKGSNAWKNLVPHIYWTITAPIRKLGKEFGWPKFTAIFLATFIIMGCIVYFVLKFISK